jgi:hypothetical protein
MKYCPIIVHPKPENEKEFIEAVKREIDLGMRRMWEILLEKDWKAYKEWKKQKIL